MVVDWIRNSIEATPRSRAPRIARWQAAIHGGNHEIQEDDTNDPVGSLELCRSGCGRSRLPIRQPFSAAALTPDSTYAAPKSTSGALAQTDPALLGRTDSTPVNVLIKYDFDATASYEGGVAGLAADEPVRHGQEAEEQQGRRAARTSSTPRASPNKISASVKAAVPSAKIGQAFTTVYGGVAAQVPANTVGDLLKVAGVAAVQMDRLEQPQTTTHRSSSAPRTSGRRSAARTTPART